MQLPINIRARISALGELSRPLGEARAARLAEELARDVAKDVAERRSPDATINGWIRRIAAEILEKSSQEKSAAAKAAGYRRISDILPEVK